MPVYRHPNGTWYVRFSKKPFGQIKRSSGSYRKSDAEALEVRLRAELQAQINTGQIGNPPRTWDEAVNKWLDSGAPTSWEPKLRQIHPWFTGTPLELAPRIAGQMTAELQADGLSPCTINRRLAAVKRVLNLAYRQWHWLDLPIAERVHLLSEIGTGRDDVYLTKEQLRSIFNAMTPERSTAHAREVKVALLLSVSTGVRESELLRLQPTDWDGTLLRIGRGKNGKPRSIPVHPSVHWIVDAHLPIQATTQQLRYWWEKGREAAGFSHIRKHDLRHTFATWYAADPSGTVTELQHLLGHSNLAVTSKYAHRMGHRGLPDSVGGGLPEIDTE